MEAVAVHIYDPSASIYEIDPTPIAAVEEWLLRFRRFWEPRFEALALEVERGKRKRRK